MYRRCNTHATNSFKLPFTSLKHNLWEVIKIWMKISIFSCPNWKNSISFSCILLTNYHSNFGRTICNTDWRIGISNFHFCSDRRSKGKTSLFIWGCNPVSNLFHFVPVGAGVDNSCPGERIQLGWRRHYAPPPQPSLAPVYLPSSYFHKASALSHSSWGTTFHTPHIAQNGKSSYMKIKIKKLEDKYLYAWTGK